MLFEFSMASGNIDRDVLHDDLGRLKVRGRCYSGFSSCRVGFMLIEAGDGAVTA